MIITDILKMLVYTPEIFLVCIIFELKQFMVQNRVIKLLPIFCVLMVHLIFVETHSGLYAIV